MSPWPEQFEFPNHEHSSLFIPIEYHFTLVQKRVVRPSNGGIR